MMKCTECGQTAGETPDDGVLCAGCAAAYDSDVIVEDVLAA